MIIDSHCHLVSYKFQREEIAELVDRAIEAGVTQMVTLATNLEDAPKHLEIAESFPSVWAAIGIHPCDVHETPDDYLTALRTFAMHPRCVAIGETGLDYFHPAPEGWTNEDYHQRQRDFLEQHFEMAAELGKNIVIHTRDKSGKQSLTDCLDIYARYADKVQAVFHCFLGPIENAKRIFELGGLISFTGISTFKSAKDCIAAAIAVPAGSFMVETDSPYLAPTPHRGQRCEPAFTTLTAHHLADARGETFDSFASHTTQTAKKFYKI